MISSWMAWNDDFTLAIFPAAVIVDIAFYTLFYGLGSSAMLRSQTVRASSSLHRYDDTRLRMCDWIRSFSCNHQERGAIREVSVSRGEETTIRRSSVDVYTRARGPLAKRLH